jgi:hypothetical protein
MKNCFHLYGFVLNIKQIFFDAYKVCGFITNEFFPETNERHAPC